MGLFEGAPIEFLVFDEAHTFRGARRAETACLIWRLRAFCGKEASDVTWVTTSAKKADPPGEAGSTEAALQERLPNHLAKAPRRPLATARPCATAAAISGALW